VGLDPRATRSKELRSAPVLERVLALFDPKAPQPRSGLLPLIISDYLAYYRDSDESRDRLALLFLPRLFHNPSLHATTMIRLALASPSFTFGLWRTALISKHSIDINRDMVIGPGFVLPHPVNILLGWGLRVGANVTILHDVSIGGPRPVDLSSPMRRPPQDEIGQLCPVIEDGVTIYMKSILMGPITVGEGAVIGARAWVEEDVESGAVVRGLTTLSG
jgi:serine acetyltransferase